MYNMYIVQSEKKGTNNVVIHAQVAPKSSAMLHFFPVDSLFLLLLPKLPVLLGMGNSIL